jgi:hypothetical protein
MVTMLEKYGKEKLESFRENALKDFDKNQPDNILRRLQDDLNSKDVSIEDLKFKYWQGRLEADAPKIDGYDKLTRYIIDKMIYVVDEEDETLSTADMIIKFLDDYLEILLR